MEPPRDLPKTLGRYELLRELGQGGMGRVLLARDTTLGRHVAVKILRLDLALAPEVKESLFLRMRQEALAVAALAHPHIVTLHDLGEAPEVGLYLVFEYVEGPSLRERLRRGALSPGEVATLARSIGDALTYGHEAGVIHRDVKPENVLLSRHGPKLADFGLARLPDSTLTGVGGVLGTPAYSAPETLAGSAFGPASDQFSFAATLYEALGGRRAFEGEDAVTVAGRVATMQPPALAEFSPLGALLGGADEVLAKALSKTPELRFASCRELGKALASELDRAFSLASLVESNERLSVLDWARHRLAPRRRNANTSLALAALVLLLGLVVVGRRQPAAEPVDGVSLQAVASSFSSATAPKKPAPEPVRKRPPPAPSLPAPPRDAGTTLTDGLLPALPPPRTDTFPAGDGVFRAGDEAVSPPSAPALPSSASSSLPFAETSHTPPYDAPRPANSSR